VHTLPGLDEAEAQCQAVREAEAYISEVEQRLRGRGFADVEQAVWYADPASAILEHASWHNVDLIAMSSHGRGGLQRLVVGSVAGKVVRMTGVPVLLHRPLLDDGYRPVSSSYRRILVPLDGSELAELILPKVVALAKGMAAEIILLKVLSPEALSDQALAGARKTLARERLDAVDYLEDVQRHLRGQDVVVRWIIRAGAPAEQIVLAAKQQVADLIAMSTHARSAVGRLIRGSVADAVLRSAPMPMLLTRSVNVTANNLVTEQT
jgi:nucleotide-binding universal stress UspA family protein